MIWIREFKTDENDEREEGIVWNEKGVSRWKEKRNVEIEKKKTNRLDREQQLFQRESREEQEEQEGNNPNFLHHFFQVKKINNFNIFRNFFFFFFSGI